MHLSSTRTAFLRKKSCVSPGNFLGSDDAGQGSPPRRNQNDDDSEYRAYIWLLYGIAFTIKMSKMGDHRINGYFDFIVPPQKGLSIAIDDKRMHHEIYLSDPRKTAADKLKTVIRYPIE